MPMHPYRTHTCGELTLSQVGKIIRLSGWVHRKRNHGTLLFIDLRDSYGITQCVIDAGNNTLFQIAENTRLESVVTVTGQIVARSEETVNTKLLTGDIEVQITGFHVESTCAVLPFSVNNDADFPEDTRLTYRFLDLRREKLHNNIVLRSQIISSIRRRMIEKNFIEFQTPILTASAPEGARDFLVPSRLHPGKFYALPQAPQQFKQLLMVAGFDRYFQIAPCFRDEDARADRSPGEFYQLDFEIAYATQEDVFSAIEPVLHGVFEEFSSGRTVSPYPFKKIPYEYAMLKYGSDKPDLRIPIEISDTSIVFLGSGFSVFSQSVEDGACVRAIPAPSAASQPRRFFDQMNDWAQSEGASGLGYIIFSPDGSAKGPIAKHLSEDRLASLREISGISDGDAVFFACGTPTEASALAGRVRLKLGKDLKLIDENHYAFCWVVDFPMFEENSQTGEIEFAHNPFSMPQGGMSALEEQDPLEIKAYQYDIVCNGIELSSGAIRNHLPEVMYKAFEIAGYNRAQVAEEFSGMLNALTYGAPPHGGCAPGIDRIVMMLAGEKNLREVIAFPMNQRAEDLMMKAPSKVTSEQLQELHIHIQQPPAEEKI